MKIRTLAVFVMLLMMSGGGGSALRALTAPDAQATAATQASRSVWDGVYTEEQARRGEMLYFDQCAFCHGDALEGGEEAPPLVGGTFTGAWNGVTLGDMLERTRVSMPMDFPGTLSRRQNADIIAFLLEVNGLPAGERELPRQDGLLQQIVFQASKN